MGWGSMDFVGGVVRRVESRSRYRRRLDRILANDQLRSTLLHRIGARGLHTGERLDTAIPSDIDRFEHFEDFVWLFSSNYANRGLSLLMLDEAGWLFRVIRDLAEPSVAELGRAIGGTTVLMAGAGAHVLSLDNESFEQGEDRRRRRPTGIRSALETTLERTGLADRVDLRSGDAMTFPVDPGQFDIVFLDIPLDPERELYLLDHWWPGVKPGGRLILRDGAEPRVPGAQAAARALRDRADASILDGAPGRFVVATRIE